MCINTKPIYNRIILKLSGEALQNINKFNIDMNKLNFIVEEIKILINIGIEVGIVIGGGNLFRGEILEKRGMNRVVADHMGMLATVMNGLAIRDAMYRQSIKVCLMSAFPLNGICEVYCWKQAVKLLSKKYVVIFSAGIGNPFFTTDSAACLRGIELQANVVLKGTTVDGVYSQDPKYDSKAILYEKLTYKDVLKQNIQVMDLTAFILAKEYNLPIRVFNINKKGILYRIVIGQKEGTIITR